jgi:hypothetical protein
MDVNQDIYMYYNTPIYTLELQIKWEDTVSYMVQCQLMNMDA